mmetsp:Transcript_6849/g.11673  ORF Transcript_6849/g.11673 Transcript_6849/m.11673 type:complete len:475 (-) Transcript_6849:559-1983(-)|eukprot:CAMPEP_0119102590 /NCGR_PEP_ID=MMETSP1180-20130426/1290_1 /TAXON_ID=3052 ORGANISM="Chlamydomonas cf sp, Strain CCMP681" /NCGR_SAMPLE_ID=MMETSP1180 /ASSEMBLY_ACC=CAM_ASM_000741 /LENGTH=474 /DNA_ID=CAMNT_0007086907 /DNA_START=87 /DNA_END=1511 /DNA_ORIENTATION=+
MAAAVEEKEVSKGYTLCYTGGTDWARIGRSIAPPKGSKKDVAKDEKEKEARDKLYPNLLIPTRLKTLAGVRLLFVAAGPAAVHCIAGDVDGRLFTWGRNEKGQLGHGDLLNRNNPTIVEGLKDKFVTIASGGRHHTVAVTQNGEAWSWGLNTQGQLGLGSIKKGTGKGVDDIHLEPAKAPLQGATLCAAGMDFSMWIAGGKLCSAGNPQFGQLGTGTDGSYNAKESSISIVYEPQPAPKVVASLSDKTITRVACGVNHTIVVDDAGSCYTFGSGGYGRLGHKVQQDEKAPRRVEEFKGRITIPADSLVAAGSTSTFCLASMGGQGTQVYFWGKVKTSGDSMMAPLACPDLTGWAVRSIACGPQHFAVAADKSAITWGHATNGELGYGPNGKKSSANAAKVLALDEVHTHSVAAGVGFTMFLVDPEAPKVAKLPEWESTVPEAEPDEAEPAEAAKSGKRKAPAAAPAAKKAAKKK